MDASRVLLASVYARVDDEMRAVEEARIDPAAFVGLYRRYLPGVYSYVRARTRHQEDASDLTQQIFLRALEALPRYRPEGLPFGAWLYRIARNAVTDFHRRSRETVAWDLLPETIQPVLDTDMAGDAVQRERIERLRAALTEVAFEQREILALRFAGGLKIREIAGILGRSEAAIKGELRRTLRRLRENYDD